MPHLKTNATHSYLMPVAIRPDAALLQRDMVVEGMVCVGGIATTAASQMPVPRIGVNQGADTNRVIRSGQSILWPRHRARAAAQAEL